MADEPSREGVPDRSSDEPPFDWEALARYTAGESSADEARAVGAWLAEHPHDAAMLAALSDVIAQQEGPSASALPITVDVEDALERVKSRRPTSRADEAKVVPMRGLQRAAPRRAMWPRALGLAAAAALVFLAIKFRGPVGTPEPVAARTYSTAVGTRDSIQLADGSRIVLAPGSRVETSADFGHSSRLVTLEGSAFFDVRHDAAMPFTVRAGGAIVRDVGTSFVVRTDGVDSLATAARGVIVAVTSGVVSLHASDVASDTGIRLERRDRGVVHPDGRVEVQRGGASEADTAWRAGRLVYRDASLDLVRADLRRWYGLELRVSDSVIARRRLTATFDGEAPGRMLEVIGLALGASVERSGDTIVLRRAAVAPR